MSDDEEHNIEELPTSNKRGSDEESSLRNRTSRQREKGKQKADDDVFASPPPRSSRSRRNPSPPPSNSMSKVSRRNRSRDKDITPDNEEDEEPSSPILPRSPQPRVRSRFRDRVNERKEKPTEPDQPDEVVQKKGGTLTKSSSFNREAQEKEERTSLMSSMRVRDSVESNFKPDPRDNNNILTIPSNNNTTTTTKKLSSSIYNSNNNNISKSVIPPSIVNYSHFVVLVTGQIESCEVRIYIYIIYWDNL